jgi:adenylate cyclase class IV
VDSFRKVLEKYGMKKTREKKKHRVSYRYDNKEFDIDKYEDIPTLLEIEAHTSEEIQECIKKL